MIISNIMIATTNIIIGSLLGIIVCHFFLYKKNLNQKITIGILETRIQQLIETVEITKNERNKLQTLSESQQNTIITLNNKNVELNSENKNLSQQSKMHQDYFDQVCKNMKNEFENLANHIFHSKSKEFSQQSEKSLEITLKPLKEKLGSFEQTVNNNYLNEAKERFALKSEVERLIGLNDRMTQDVKTFAQALLGNSKIQGDWGELVLERILEESGLTEGREYHAQKHHENEEGDRMRPDFRINLPEDKHIIVDSKVSLKSYELYCRTENNELKTNALSSHLKSIQTHIDDLANKHYSKLKGIKSPEFVFAFIPIEPAYILAMKSDPGLSSKAWRKGIAIVTATTLLTSLKTVASIWKLENQNRNALQIADEAGKLYDKFCSFLDDFLKIGKTFEMGQTQYISSMNKLKHGSGNIFRKMETIRTLGASPKNRIKQDLLDSTDSILETNIGTDS